MHLMFMTVLYIIAKIMESTQVLINICIDKEDVVYVYTQRMSHYSAINLKKNETLPFATTWMDLGGIILSEKSRTMSICFQIDI